MRSARPCPLGRLCSTTRTSCTSCDSSSSVCLRLLLKTWSPRFTVLIARPPTGHERLPLRSTSQPTTSPASRGPVDRLLPTTPLMSSPVPTLSVVIPLLNEEEVLGQTYAELKQHLDALGESYEMVFVDDGSTDRSRAILADLSRTDPTVRVVALS